MTKIAFSPNSSGTGTFTLATPNSNTNRTFTLPDANGNLLTFESNLDASKLTGALPAIDGSALTGIETTPTTADVLSATAGATTGAVGTYAWLVHTTVNLDVIEGSTYAGSVLRYTGVTPAGLTNSYGGNYHWPQTRGAPAGTWRAMGGVTAMWSSRYCNTLFMRIS